MISLIKKQDNSQENSQENQKELQKAMFLKKDFIVNITDFESNENENDNTIKTGINYIYVSYQKNYHGYRFLKTTLKKLLKLKNITFKDFSKQELQQIIDTPIRCLCENY